ncbi:hypothetical protein Y032_0020g104 [Ancylostoma ceylanicum]|nr:hypothetical protein Y032_0020g104 [Ancylostoma ceylanicum]
MVDIGMRLIWCVLLMAALPHSMGFYFIFDMEKLFSLFRKNGAEQIPLPELECPDHRLDPAIRSIFHRFHNDLRRKVAKGEYLSNGSKLGPVSNMYELAYDCVMEEMAESLDDNSFNGLKEMGINFSEIKNPWEKKMHEVIEEILQSWTETSFLRQMVHFATTRVGCSYYIVPDKYNLHVVCIYDSKPNEGDALVVQGAACSHNNNCTWISPSECADGLCFPSSQNHSEYKQIINSTSP